MTEAEEISIDVTLEEEITVDLTIEEMAIEETAIDSAEETDLDPALQETIELQQDKATTMISEDDQERDPDLVAEMHLHTVETGIEMTTDMLSEEAWLTTEAEAQTENRAAEDLTMTEEASFQIRSHTARDLPTEEKEAEAEKLARTCLKHKSVEVLQYTQILQYTISYNIQKSYNIHKSYNIRKPYNIQYLTIYKIRIR